VQPEHLGIGIRHYLCDPNFLRERLPSSGSTPPLSVEFKYLPVPGHDLKENCSER
jgi:hypothetical protein